MSRAQSSTSTAEWPRFEPATSNVVGAALKLLNVDRQTDDRREED
jgi:hypothetical protein